MNRKNEPIPIDHIIEHVCTEWIELHEGWEQVVFEHIDTDLSKSMQEYHVIVKNIKHDTYWELTFWDTYYGGYGTDDYAFTHSKYVPRDTSRLYHVTYMIGEDNHWIEVEADDADEARHKVVESFMILDVEKQ